MANITKNIIDYANTQLKTFDELPFNEVDSLILSQLSYLHFNEIVGGINEGKEHVPIHSLLKAELFDGILNQVLSGDKCKELLIAMGMSPRFRDIGLNYYEENSNQVIQEQFASVTYLLPDGSCYVAFRGTDTTIVGWREDFNMAFMEIIPSQKKALKQLSRVLELENGKVMVGGHSKGGNLSEYAGAMVDEQDRISVIFSHDGPGFRKDVFANPAFERIMPKVKKTVPGFSVVGRMLQGHEIFKVVKSTEKFIMQHDPFSWEVEDEDFVYMENVAGDADTLATSINEWLMGIDDDGRKKFVDALFNVLEASNITSLDDFTDERQKSILSLLDAANGVDPDTKRFVLDTVKSLCAVSFKNSFSWLPTIKK